MKYPRTFHLPWSPGGTKDDRRLSSTKHLLDTNLVLTEKMDGSNVCLESGNVFARSHSSAPSHPSFDALKAYWAERASDREGIVVRRADGFDNAHFSTCVAKWVRKHHVQTDDHWKRQAITRNTKAAPK